MAKKHKSLKDIIINYAINNMIEDIPIDTVRKRLYDRVVPASYDDAYFRFKNAINKNSPVYNGDKNFYAYVNRDDIWANYLQIPESKRRNDYDGMKHKVINSKYSPTIGSQGDYKTLTDMERFYPHIIREAKNKSITETTEEGGRIEEHDPLNFGQSKVSKILGNFFGPHLVSRGLDPKRGEYISFYDKWDLSPIGEANTSDESRGIGKPIEFYDRIYLDDYYDIPEEYRKSLENAYYAGYLPEVEITGVRNNNRKIIK